MNFDESAKLAQERGSYPNFQGSGWSKGFLPIEDPALLSDWLQDMRGLLIALVVMADYAYRMSTVLRVTKDSVTIKSLLPGQRVVPRAAIRGLALRDVYSYPYRRLIAVIYIRFAPTDGGVVVRI